MSNAHPWQIGKALPEQAITGGCDYRSETAPGGRTIAQLLEKTARSGHRLHVRLCGLASADLHLRRVRWQRSRENLVRLLPLIDHLRIDDNSAEADHAAGHRPKQVLLLEMQSRTITAPADRSGSPDRAQPIVAAAIHPHTAERQGPVATKPRSYFSTSNSAICTALSAAPFKS